MSIAKHFTHHYGTSILPSPTKMKQAVDNSNLIEEVDSQGQVCE
jgi:hypothetical protein